eukprot:TRINITY_DN9116_c0_g1_i1.p1 TRINITY_DN9116_c0_g1~~TRINITY_DN9116_c0_g1_i1.p1  ORF type:complete len:663 (+),score=203.52 TRINITY_DN9116_c0_g1_i1:175-1989(+)
MKKVTFVNQDNLPRLPVPNLEDTLQGYEHYITPLLSSYELEKTKSNIQSFSGISGKTLQNDLLTLNDESPVNWLEGFWDSMYLELRCPSPINVNPYFIVSQNSKSKTQDQITAASNIINPAFKYQQLIRRSQYLPDMDKDKPLCMYQHSLFLGTSRIPQPGRDELHKCRHANHIVVLHNGNFFKLDIMDNPTSTDEPLGYEAILSVEDIKAKLEKIVEESKSKGEGEGVETLTTENRSTWASAYSELLKDTTNAQNIDYINTSLFVLCLDQTNTDDLTDLGVLSMRGETNYGKNRWFDKFQINVTENGRIGLNMEHTPTDGHTLLRFISDVYNDIYTDKTFENADYTFSQEVGSELKKESPMLLNWNINDKLDGYINTAKKNFTELSDSTESIHHQFNDFGKDAIKKVNISPDAFVQMAYQLAYYRENGTLASTYESGLTKNFLHGRTETIRSVSPESAKFVQEFNPDDVETTKKLLQEAAAKHVLTSSNCKNGKGVDRHLFALYNLSKQRAQRISGYNIPGLFLDPSYSKYMSNLLSTSNCGTFALDLFGFGPVHNDGIGIGYIIKNDCLQFNVTSFKPKSKIASSYISTLDSSLKELLTIAK